MIFTQATVAEVPFLNGTLEWQVNVNKDEPTSPRQIETLRLIQFDFAVRDSRADETTGWVFGALVYDGDQPGTTVSIGLFP